MKSEQFIGKVRESGGALELTIPSSIHQFIKLKSGDNVRVTIEKA